MFVVTDITGVYSFRSHFHNQKKLEIL